MSLTEQDRDRLKALMPFRVGRAEILLVPNKRGNAEPTVLLITGFQDPKIARQLTLTETRRLAAYLNVAADEAEALERPMVSLREPRAARQRSH